MFLRGAARPFLTNYDWERCKLPQQGPAEPRPPNDFPIFYVHWMASPIAAALYMLSVLPLGVLTP